MARKPKITNRHISERRIFASLFRKEGHSTKVILEKINAIAWCHLWGKISLRQLQRDLAGKYSSAVGQPKVLHKALKRHKTAIFYVNNVNNFRRRRGGRSSSSGKLS